MRHFQVAVALTLLSLAFAAPTFAEKPAEKNPQKADLSGDTNEAADSKAILRRLNDQIDPVHLENAKAKDAFKWWATTTGVSIVIDWRQMEEDGVDADKAINVDLHNVPAGKMLGLLMKQTSPDTQLMYEVTPWYIQITTKARAARTLVTRFYDVSDLVHEPLPVRSAPKLDLSSALNSSKGGSSSILGGGGGERSAVVGSKDAAAKQLIDAITNSIEPDLWEARGGESTISYFRGFLVVKAPVFVHAQIGLPVQGNTPRPIIGTGGGGSGGGEKDLGDKPTDRPGYGVGGVSSFSPSKTGGVAK
jgi:hypothetical protein